MNRRDRPQTQHVSCTAGPRPSDQKPAPHVHQGSPLSEVISKEERYPSNTGEHLLWPPQNPTSLEPLYPMFLALPQATPNWQPIPASACPPSTVSSLGRVVYNCFLSSQALFVCTVAASSHPSTPEALTSSVGLLGPSPQLAVRCWASPPQTHHLEPRNPARPWRQPPLSTSPSFRHPQQLVLSPAWGEAKKINRWQFMGKPCSALGWRAPSFPSSSPPPLLAPARWT